METGRHWPAGNPDGTSPITGVMNSIATTKVSPCPTSGPGLVSYYNTEGSPPPGKVDVGVNVLDVHDVSIPAAQLKAAAEACTGLKFELVGRLHTHTVTLTPAQVGTLVATGRLTLWSEWAKAHKHSITLSPGDGSAAQDVRFCLTDTPIAKRWVKV